MVAVTAAQTGKTDSMLDIIGARLDQRPAPIIYVGPTKEFLTDQFGPRLMCMRSAMVTKIDAPLAVWRERGRHFGVQPSPDVQTSIFLSYERLLGWSLKFGHLAI